MKKDNIGVEPPDIEPYVLSVDATLPDSTTTEPRMVYTDARYVANGFFTTTGSFPVSATWTNGEQIEFCFKQGSTLARAVATVTNASGVRCKFSVVVPATINPANSFDLFAVNGGMPSTTLSKQKMDYITNGSSLITLRQNVANIKNSLAADSLPKAIVQVARLPGLPGGTKTATLNFKQIGSLIGFSIMNTSTVRPSITNLALTGANNWVYANGAQYDLATGTMSGTTTKTLTFLSGSFPFAGTTSYTTVYQWFVPTLLATGALTINMSVDNNSASYVVAGTGISITDRGVLQPGMRYYINKTLKLNTTTNGFEL